MAVLGGLAVADIAASADDGLEATLGEASCSTRGGLVSADSTSDEEDTLSTADTLGQHDSTSELAEVDAKDPREPKDHSSATAESVAATIVMPCCAAVVAASALADFSPRGSALPVVRLRVKVHTEMHRHTVYLVECALTPLGKEMLAPALAWTTTKRLLDLRRGLHDRVKRELGREEYARCFRATPFAHRAGPPGTTSRLDKWCKTLAACMTAGDLSPVVIAEVFRVLDAPDTAYRP
mmetsp:Transcript_26330/g.55917  ORF Transcript_26330/g.55917 Transcript_26330/m.55917 type:complete len:238 (-) Transcript_26330:99-812(-)